MKNTVIVGSLLSISLTLIGCAALHDATQVSTSIVKAGGQVVTTTGHAVGTTVNAGVNLLTGRPATRHHVATYRKHGVVHHNGHTYKIEHGKYILIR